MKKISVYRLTSTDVGFGQAQRNLDGGMEVAAKKHKNHKKCFSAFSWLFPLLFWPSAVFAQEDGAYLFKTYCAICHESGGGEARAPDRDVLRQMTPEHILSVL